MGSAGMGQRRLVVGFRVDADNASQTILHLEAPFDAYVGVTSVVAVTGSVGRKIVAGNTFTWGMVVQTFGLALGSVLADNDLVDMNACPTGYGCPGGGGGAMEVFGLCAAPNGMPTVFGEYTGNTFVRSNGIDLFEHGSADGGCVGYPGPYLRWQAIVSLLNCFSSVNEPTFTWGPCFVR
eukprot:m.783249 g.783249  ORF g.783249 m.783249 type:complete len:180 (-) comp23294_c0_seq2:725-1264(-)